MIRSAESLLASKRVPLFLSLCVLVVGCTNIEKSSDVKYQPTDPDSVKIIQVTPYRSFQKIGEVDARWFDKDDSNGLYNSIRERAASEGADAVIIKDQGLDDSSLVGDNRWVKGEAIHYN